MWTHHFEMAVGSSVCDIFAGREPYSHLGVQIGARQ
jgi:hypothetical protein